MSANDFVECWRCKSSNPSGKKFCGECGATLDTVVGPLREAIQTSVRDEIRAALKDQMRDQKLVELETTDNVQTRVLGWAKNVGVILGVALAIAGFGLSWLGTSSWKEIKSNAESKMKEEVAAAQKDLHERFQDALNKQQKQAQEQLNVEIATSQKSIKHDLDSAQEAANQARRNAESVRVQTASELRGVDDRLSAVEKLVSPGIRISIYDGARRPIPKDLNVLLTVRDGGQKELLRKFGLGSEFLIPKIPFQSNLADNCVVLVSARGYQDIGIFPVKLSLDRIQSVDLMLLPVQWKYNFNPNELELLRKGNGLTDRFKTLEQQAPDSAAMLLNVIAVWDPFIGNLEEISWDELTGTQVVAYVRHDLIEYLQRAVQSGQMLSGPSPLAGGQHTYREMGSEASLEVAVHEEDHRRIGNVDCVKLVAWFFYFKDPGSFHVLRETTTDTRGVLTDPRTVYTLRWMSGRKPGVAEFAPAYTIIAKR